MFFSDLTKSKQTSLPNPVKKAKFDQLCQTLTLCNQFQRVSFFKPHCEYLIKNIIDNIIVGKTYTFLRPLIAHCLDNLTKKTWKRLNTGFPFCIEVTNA